MRSWVGIVVAGLVVGALVSAAQGQVYVYPKPGQSQDDFEKDQWQCHNWATQQTGFNPSAPPQMVAAPPPQGGAVRGAAGGAAMGAIGGAIAGNAGKGAAVGAAVGGTAGVMRRRAYERAAAEQAQEAHAQQQAAYGNYERAYAACLSGRGYSVR